MERMGRNDIRKKFRTRFDTYARAWTIEQAVDTWRKDNKTTEPLFTKAMWETISGAVYPTPAELERQRSQHRAWKKERERRQRQRVLEGNVIDKFTDTPLVNS